MVIIDGDKGEIIVRPDAATLQHYRQELAKKQREDKKLKSLRDVPSVTTDGTPITLQANLELPREVEAALEAGASGIGLLRTEFLFMNRPDLPDEDEQFEALRKLVHKLDGTTVDRPHARCRRRKTGDGARRQRWAKAPIRRWACAPSASASRSRNCWTRSWPRFCAPAPMARCAFSSRWSRRVAQMKQVREHMMQVERRLQRRGVKLPARMPPLGAMIEIPAAALGGRCAGAKYAISSPSAATT